MPTVVNIVVNDQGAIKAFEAFPETRKMILSRALNRTAAWSRTRALDAITSTLNVKKSDLDGKHRFGGVAVKRSTLEHLEATVNVTGNRIPLFLFHGSPKTPPTPHGIAYQIDAGGGKKTQTLNVFVGVMASGHIGFFKRESEGTKHFKRIALSGKHAGKPIWMEEPLIELYGPSVPHVAEENPAFKKLLEVDASDRLALQVERETNFVLTGNSSTSPSEGGDG